MAVDFKPSLSRAGVKNNWLLILLGYSLESEFLSDFTGDKLIILSGSFSSCFG